MKRLISMLLALVLLLSAVPVMTAVATEAMLTEPVAENFEEVPDGKVKNVAGFKAAQEAVITDDPVNQGEKALRLCDTTKSKPSYLDYGFGSGDQVTIAFDAYIPEEKNTVEFQIYNGSKSTQNAAFQLQFDWESGLRVFDGSAYKLINADAKLEAGKWCQIMVQVAAGENGQAEIYLDGGSVGTTQVACSQQPSVNGIYIVVADKTQACFIDNLQISPAVQVRWIIDGKEIVTNCFGGAVPAFAGTPEKAFDSDHHYRFTGWDKPITAAAYGDAYTAQFEPVAHEMGQWQQAIAPSFSCEGVEERSCLCGYMQYQNVPALGNAGFSETEAGIRLDQDVEVTALTVDAGKTLDLNGYTLQTGKMVCLGSVVDSAADNTGKLIADTLRISNLADMPIYDSAKGCYRFFSYELKNLGIRKNLNGTMTCGVAIVFENEEAYTLLASDEMGVAVSLEATWEDGRKAFTVDAAMVQQYAQYHQQYPDHQAAMMLTISGLSGEELIVTPAAEVAGTVAAAEPMIYINKGDEVVEGSKLSVTISADKAELALGESLNLNITGAGADSAVRWFSRTPSFAMVDGSGKVTAVGVGNAEVYAVVLSGNDTVTSNMLTMQVLDPTAPVRLEATAAGMPAGAVGKVSAVAYNCFEEEIANGVEWKYISLNPELLQVDAEGNYCGNGEGQAELLVMATNGVVSVSEKISVAIYPSWDTDGDGVLSILAVGNSFSVDAMEYAYNIARDLGFKKVVLGNLFVGSCSLEMHVSNISGDMAAYTYYYNDSGTWTTTKDYKVSTALESRSWDFISLQQASGVSGVEDTYNGDLDKLIAYVQARSNARLLWHMTWAYQQDSTHGSFPTYKKDQMIMYNGILSAVQNRIIPNGNFDWIIPNGTAVQNSRTSLLGDTTTRDGYHMSYDYGRYLTGLGLIKAITGADINNVAYRPDGVSAQQRAIAIESVNNAMQEPFAVTKSSYTGG